MALAALLLGLLALLLALAALRLFASAPVESVKKGIAYGAAGLGILVAGALLAAGRGPQLLWAFALFGPAIWHWWRARRFARRFAGGSASEQESRVTTATLEMVLDHATGRMTGRVLAGRFAGAELAELGQAAVLELRAECQLVDPESIPLLEAWLDRAHPGWRASSPPPAPDAPMSRAEALAILGLAEGASEDAVRAAHRRMMRAAHPDRGGSDWLAARLNAARDLLLRRGA